MLDFICGKIISPATAIAVFFGGLFFGICMLLFGRNKKSPSNTSFCRKNDISKNKISPLCSLSLALAGTLGVGNITGVAAAIISGGAGAIFWMWVSGIVAMPLKYAEVNLAIKTRITDKAGIFHGGAMYYVKNTFFASAFALLCIFNSFFLGNTIQARAASDALRECFGINPVIVGAAGAILTFAVIFGGVKRISDVTARLIPLLCGIFVLLSGIIIIRNFSLVPSAFRMIFADAFNIRAAGGGIFGFLLLPSVRFGVARGLFSNEAGCGTAPIAHAESDGVSAEKQGYLGIFEVFADTLLLCTITALVILIFGQKYGFASGDGMKTVTDAFSLLLGDFSGKIIAASTAFFALATVICWAHYGSEAVYYVCLQNGLRPSFWQKIYFTVYSAAVFVGVFSENALIWQTADLAVGCMTVINIVSLVKSVKIIFRLEYRES